MSSVPLWTAAEIAAATGGTASGDFAVHGVAFDSREIQPGDLFVAMKGEATDGHRFIDKAIAAGAAAVLCETAIAHPHVRVEDSAAALQALGRAARDRSGAVIIGVTGSAGKTGTKEALFLALDRASFGRAHRSVKSYNNHVGVPLSLARMPRHARFGVFEMGMNHAGELSELTKIVRPHVAIVTTIAPAHIGHFPNVEAIAHAKAEIFEGLVEGGTAIIPGDNPHLPILQETAQRHAATIVRFGLKRDNPVRALDTVRSITGGTLVTAQMDDNRLCYTVAAPGEHWVANSLAVMAAVRAAGADLAVAGLALAEMPGLAGRGERHRLAWPDGGEALLIDESYNANPASMRVTIEGLSGETATRRIVILGAMKELGRDSDAYHIALSEPIFAAKVDLAILVGDEMQNLVQKLSAGLEMPVQTLHVPDAATAMAAIRGEIRPGDAVLVKGSNAVGLSAVVRDLVDLLGEPADLGDALAHGGRVSREGM